MTSAKGSAIFSALVLDANAPIPTLMFSMPFSKVTVVKPVPTKALSPISLTFFGITRSPVSVATCRNADLSIFSKAEFKTIAVIFVPKKASLPRDLTFSGKVTAPVIPSQLCIAKSPISVTVSGMTKLSVA